MTTTTTPPLDVAAASQSVALVETGDGTGTAFVIADHQLLTNAHVVGRSSMVTVRFPDGGQVSCAVSSYEATIDLATLSCDTGSRLPLVLAGRSPGLGTDVVSIGYPRGEGPVATKGIVSANITTEQYLRTDAAANPGNSGGPLLDNADEVVGVVSAVDRDQTSATYAIRVEDVRSLLHLPVGERSPRTSRPVTTIAPRPSPSGDAQSWLFPGGVALAVLVFVVGTRLAARVRRPVASRALDVRLIEPDIQIRLHPARVDASDVTTKR